MVVVSFSIVDAFEIGVGLADFLYFFWGQWGLLGDCWGFTGGGGGSGRVLGDRGLGVKV